MLQSLFQRKLGGRLLGASRQDRLEAMEGSESAALAAELLRAPNALMQLDEAESRTVVSYMLPMRIPAGNTFIKQGDRESTDYMMLVLEGEITVETIVVSRTEPVVLNVLGQGALIGELGLLDGEPRSASCTASMAVSCAIFTRRALEDLMRDDPRTAAKLMMAISARLAQRIRETSEKLNRFAMLTKAMQQEIDRLMPT